MDEDDRVPQALDELGQHQAEAAAPLRPQVIHEVVREEGEVELRRAAEALALSGFAAGLSMGFSFLTLALLRAGLPDTPWRRLIDSFGYSLGFVIVILGRQQLFTESTLTAVLPVLTSRTLRSLLSTLRLWGIVLASNLVGTFVFAALITPEGVFPREVRTALLEVGRESLSGSFGPVLLKAVFAGWLIALMVWLLPNARQARLWVIILLTYVVSMGGFSHIIAGSTEASFAVFAGGASVSDYVWGFLIPTLVGNTIGGVSLVALLNHAPVAQELRDAGGR
ncbi:MAG TPA: formate/nitrite transporter family protein [Acetobacteraceae bacterium]|nr:formate/nitrite transporter family protein [Acetobacteraceae bacterium]